MAEFKELPAGAPVAQQVTNWFENRSSSATPQPIVKESPTANQSFVPASRKFFVSRKPSALKREVTSKSPFGVACRDEPLAGPSAMPLVVATKPICALGT